MRNHRHNSNPAKQTGLSAMGGIFAVAVLVAVVVLTLRLAPAYIDFQTLRSVMNGLSGPEIHAMDKRAIYESLEKRFKINNLRSFDARDVIAIDRNKTQTTLRVSYEVREPLLFNADIVLVFKDEYNYH